MTKLNDKHIDDVKSQLIKEILGYSYKNKTIFGIPKDYFRMWLYGIPFGFIIGIMYMKFISGI